MDLPPLWQCVKRAGYMREETEEQSKPFTEIQAIQLDLLRRVCYNSLDGARVVDDLYHHRDTDPVRRRRG